MGGVSCLRTSHSDIDWRRLFVLHTLGNTAFRHEHDGIEMNNYARWYMVTGGRAAIRVQGRHKGSTWWMDLDESSGN